MTIPPASPMTLDKVGTRPKIAVIVTGGTLTALANDPFEICDYGQAGSLDGQALVSRCEGLAGHYDFIFPSFVARPSFDMAAPECLELCRLCQRTLNDHPDLVGFVLTHGTGTLEETAFFLSRVWDFPVPVVLTGAQRPASALSSDGYMNFYQSVMLAVSSYACNNRVLVVMNGDIHAPDDVTKRSNFDLDTFISPNFGPLARIIGKNIIMRNGGFAGQSKPTISWRELGNLPRVDILYCHAGGDTCAIEAFVAAGARGIVVAGFPPGYATSRQAARLTRWITEAGGTVIMASRGTGPVVNNTRNNGHQFIPGGRYLPVKARILLQFALAEGKNFNQIAQLFTE